MFQLGQSEYDSLRFQSGTLNNSRGKHRKYLPLVFSEQGAIMLSTVLKSDRAVEMNVAIMRAFVQFRRTQGVVSALSAKLEEHEVKFNRLAQQYELQSREFLNAIQELKFQISATAVASSKITSGSEQLPLDTSRSPGLRSKGKSEGPLLAYGFGTLESGHRRKIETICKAVAEYYGLAVEDLRAVSRAKQIALPRQVAIYLVRKMVGTGFKDLGRVFGGKNHTTVIHAYLKIEKAVTEKDLSIFEAIESIGSLIKKREIQIVASS
jgi:hypothetical protein